MEEENEVVTTTTENVETPTTEEKVEKQELFTAEQQEKINEIINTRVARAKRAEAKKYEKILNSLEAGLGTKDLDELGNKVTEFYKEQGVTIPDIPKYSAEDEKILAEAEANKIIKLGYDAIKNETEYYKSLSNLSGREKEVYNTLLQEQLKQERLKSLKQIGVSDEEIGSKDFKEFADKFNSNIPYTEIYELYSRTKPKQEPSSIGSMKSTKTADEIKDYYSPEDVDKLTDEQLNNPKIWERVMESKKKWVE